jgi:hypothetical protein
MKWRKSVDMRNVPTACTGNESQHIQATKNRGTDQSDVNFDTASGDVASAMVRHDQVSISLFFFTILLDTRISFSSLSLPCYPVLFVRILTGTPGLRVTIE